MTYSLTACGTLVHDHVADVSLDHMAYIASRTSCQKPMVFGHDDAIVPDIVNGQTVYALNDRIAIIRRAGFISPQLAPNSKCEDKSVSLFYIGNLISTAPEVAATPKAGRTLYTRHVTDAEADNRARNKPQESKSEYRPTYLPPSRIGGTGTIIPGR